MLSYKQKSFNVVIQTKIIQCCHTNKNYSMLSYKQKLFNVVIQTKIIQCCHTNKNYSMLSYKNHSIYLYTNNKYYINI
jgi:hypothetical protein